MKVIYIIYTCFTIVAVPTYILGSNSAPTDAYYADLPESGELCPNLTYLGARGLYTVASGIKIAYVSGVEGGGGVPHQFDEAAVRAVQKSCLTSRTAPTDYRGVDILITSQWPAGVDDSAPAQVGSKMLSWLAQEIRPRYHFCGMADVYFERVPYRSECFPHVFPETIYYIYVFLQKLNEHDDKH